MALVLGIDVSTTATKAVLIDERGAIAAIGTAEYGFDVPHPGWSEQDPRLWWDGAIGAVGTALAHARVDGSAVAAVGLTGQMHGAVLLSADDEPLRPAILWNDQRTARECQVIRDAVGPERLIEITGNDALTGFTAPKLVWVRDNEPELWAQTRHVLLPKDYLRLCLTGEHAMDKADGSGTILFDLAARDWSPEVLAALRIDPALMPPTFEGPVVTGTVSASAAAATGLRAGTPVVAGGGDQSANAVGVGRCRPRHRGVVARYVRRRLCEHRHAAVREARPCSRLLPRRARTVAHDERHALGRGQPALVPRRPRAGYRFRRSRCPCHGRRGGRKRPVLPALSDRRKIAPSRPGRPRRVRRA